MEITQSSFQALEDYGLQGKFPYLAMDWLLCHAHRTVGCVSEPMGAPRRVGDGICARPAVCLLCPHGDVLLHDTGAGL